MGQQAPHLFEHDPDIVRHAALSTLGVAPQKGTTLRGARDGILDMLELVFGELHQLVHHRPVPVTHR